MTIPPTPISYVTPQVNREAAKEKRKRILRRVAIIAAVSFVLIIVIVGLLGAVVDHLLFREQPFNQKLASQAVTQIMNGILKPVNGVVALPPALSSTSLNAEAHVMVDSSGATWVLFRTWRGRGADLKGFLYHSSPTPSPAPTELSMWGPYPMGGPGMVPYISVVGQEGPNWYRVDRRMD